MANFNKVILAGNLTRDPELRYIADGTPVTDCGLAVNSPPNKAGVRKTVFIDLTFWRRTAEVVCEYCKKGSSVLVDGKLEMDQWEKDGQKFSKIKVIVENFQMLDKKSDLPANTGKQATNQTPASDLPSDSEIPF